MYYTPSIDEFHVGFEYERKNLLDSSVWVKESFSDRQSAKDLVEDPVYCVRVKHLDREDIEDFGFKIYSTGIFRRNVFLRGKEIECDIRFGRKFLTIEFWSNLTCYTAFCGELRNKSELKTILRQTGVEFG